MVVVKDEFGDSYKIYKNSRVRILDMDIKVFEDKKVVVGYGYPKIGDYVGDRIKVVAKCRSEDEFDKDFGIKLCKKKLYKKAAEAIYKMAIDMDKFYTHLLAGAIDLKNVAESAYEYSIQEEQRLLNLKYPHNKE